MKIPPGSIRSSVFTLVTSTVGSGVLSLPFATSQSGAIPAILLIIGAASTAYFSIWMLLKCSELSAEQGGTACTYQQLAGKCGGLKFLKFTKWVLVINLFGTTVAYMVVIATIVPAAIEAMSSSVDPNAWYLQRWFILLFVVAFIEMPLGLMKEMNALRYTSIIAIFWSLYLTTITIVEYFEMCGDASDDNSPKCFSESFQDERIVWGPTTFAGFAQTVPIMIFAYTCQPNVLPVYLEMSRPSPGRMLRVGRISITICTCIYVAISLFGYLTFTDNVEGDYLLNDYKHHREVLAGGFGLVLSVALCIPLFVHAGRFNIMGGQSSSKSNGVDAPYSQIPEPMESAIFDEVDSMNQDQMNGHSGNHENGTNTWAQYVFNPEVMHYWTTILWLIAAYGIASSIENIAIVIGILGSTTIPIISFVLPTIFMSCLANGRYRLQRYIAIILTIVVCVFCLANLLYQIKDFAGK
eukprot:CAMPEP_0184503796 /NCGR_PEP_ID=MMETSP0113_2-20130426/52096_1 /TAXON_ID=91329 /ORGANISM="Norrisiella sphaerica, Strain BC52" /LENGTH=466 /DNA_ID=CAMNT_0026893353 /DNA_START=2944 /DNA_END=4344 /DNA_ORIENTATION=-